MAVLTQGLLRPRADLARRGSGLLLYQACIACDGNLGRNTFLGPGQWTTDQSLFKNIKVTEPVQLPVPRRSVQPLEPCQLQAAQQRNRGQLATGSPVATSASQRVRSASLDAVRPELLCKISFSERLGPARDCRALSFFCAIEPAPAWQLYGSL